MYEILKKEKLNASVTLMLIHAPLVAKKAKAGQFIILQVEENGERIPLTVADYDRNNGTVTVIFQVVGTTTKKLDMLEKGNKLHTFVGPLGNATNISNYKKVAIVGGGVGCAIAYPIAKAIKSTGAKVHSIIGFRNNDLVILKNEFENVSDELFLVTDDGSTGTKGLVTDILKKLIENKGDYDVVFAVGPLMMMKCVSDLTKKYDIKTVVSMNPIMIDGTGMCGGCRLTVGDKMKFACIDGPDFDGHKVDFDEAIKRGKMFLNEERKSYENTCNLLKKGNLSNGK